MKEYGYCRISTPQQSIDRQERNIKAKYPKAHISKEAYTGTKVVVHEKSRIGKYVLIKGGTRISSNVPPFVIMAHNPVSYYGVNSIVMQKHCGFTEQQIDDIAKAYRHIYQCSTSVFNALKRIETDIDPSPVREEILTFVRENNMKLAGDRFEAD